jgi:glycosyltransferase involved in cell wall biosynthesis
MAKIRIVRIIARLNVGGPAINASILSSCLDKDRFETKVLYGSLAEGEAGLEYLMRSDGVDTELIPELGREIKPQDDLVAFWKILKVLWRVKPDIVHTHTAKAGTLGRLAAIFAGTKVKIHTFHGNVFKHYFSKAKTGIFIFIERMLGLFTTKVITVSEKQKAELIEEFRIVPARKCRVIPLGLDLARLKEAKTGDGLRKELGAKDDELLVGIMGRLVPIKNHKMFFEAAALVRKLRPDLKARYVIIGGGELEKELRELAVSLGIGDIAHFMGWRQDLGNVYRGLDVVALTSLNEGTPLALIEAMAVGRAIISVDVGGVSDIIENGRTGILTKKNDTEGFAKGLISLLKDRELRQRYSKAALAASERFDKSNLVKSMTELYTECINKK